MQTFIKGALLSLTFAAMATAANASGVSYTCAASINADGGAGLCSSINTVVAGDYNSIFSNANASIYVQFANNGGLGNSAQVINQVSYTDFLSALTSHSSHNATDTSAIASLPVSEPAMYQGANVGLTSALSAALGFTGTGVTSSLGICTIGSSGCYNAVITLNDPTDLAALTGGQGYYYGTGPQGSNDYAFDSILEHETDEVLGTASCVSVGTGPTLSDDCGANTPSAVDLFRYSAPGTRVLESTTPGAYFSSNGGVTAQSPAYNTNSPGEDYADYATNATSNCLYVQTTEGCLGAAPRISNDGGSEVTILDAVGYNLNSTVATTPEPSSLILLGSGLVGLSGLIRRRLLAA